MFWAGIDDLGAATAFLRIAAMHKRPSTTLPGPVYVHGDPDTSYTSPQAVDLITTVRDEP
ncbi:hypothetical protein [Amycolatopsis anabasis]|uniref:hypothetical protein n=1 Tax=Amycolatopsis anabasis TaxID=1840409 RepID=UPI00131B8C46|nr:hypothetical protein [Amycolatopsis anabasis]